MPWLRLAALALVVAGLGLPINDLFRYALLLLAAVPIFAGHISNRLIDWVAAFGVVTLTIAAQLAWPAPRIDEGHNVFIVDGLGGALERTLPADAFRQMSAEFDARFPPDHRCQTQSSGCWRSGGFPDRAYAFSADGIYQDTAYSRRVTDIDFSDPVWHRLGFINESKYNWGGTGELQRGKRNPWNVLHPWRLDMPYFVMSSFSGRLRRQPAVLARPRAVGRPRRAFHRVAAISSFRCRPIEPADIGRRIFGVSIGCAAGDEPRSDGGDTSSTS